MTGLTSGQRVVGWNVRIILKSGIASCLAGFYQQDDFLTVGDVRRELDLCFRLDEGENRLPALIPTGKPGVLLLLDKYDPTAFPTPPTDQQAEYYYVTHNPGCQTPRAEHSLASTCIQQTTRPPRQYDARYLPIGKASDDPFIKLVRMRGKKRPRTTSQSPSRSRSPTKGGDGDGLADDDEFPETLISKEEAAPIMSDFRQNVIGIGNSRCAVSGKGGAWWAGNGIGPAVQAAHVVPQIHWNVYPDTEQGIAPLADISALREAWIQTWDMSNGLLLAATIHQCFDARILSINPDTSRIRAFMPYDVITEYHGKKADLPRGLDFRALRHHYDMCCIENMAAQKQPGLGLSTVVRNKATTMIPVTQSRPDTYVISIALAACQDAAAIGPPSLTSAKNYAAAGWSMAKQVEITPAISGTATSVGKYTMEKAGEGASWAAKNPGSAACAAVAVGGLAVVAAPAIVTSPMLAAAGFGSSGPVAGGIAAGVQSMIGNVAAGGLFATFQSAAMGGYGAVTVATAAQGVGLGVAAAGGAAAAKTAK